VSADQGPRRGSDQPQRSLDVVALTAGVIFVLFSITSLTVGVLDLPDIGAAPLWLILIAAGGLLLVSELRGRNKDQQGR